ncbi:NADPH:quinone oxidoreductase family protein [Jongsikchunia kroppenstedtii]|uniref:NADPH:quinone oxidoreductase family protein n=1 Tax=Jongsikchunia kroppenstedtii TaxID=1121721 RepID=UPI0003795A48|nr:NADPH:quinone oxidoreductase family protein [Jongsikchunia kroppenstedtii]
MRAQVLTEEIGPDGLQLQERPDPVPQPGMAVVDVKACGVCFPDVLMTQGKYQLRPELPFVTGTEVAGVVSAVADGETAVKVGDRVLTTVLGGFAEKTIAPAQMMLPMPPELTFDEGAALGINYQTAYFALKIRADLQPDETVLVLGSAGGIGVATIQVAKAMGAKVIAAVHRTGAADMLTELGADHVVQLEEGWGDKVKELTGGAGAEVVMDPVGGDVFDEALRQTKRGGRYVVIGFAAGGIPTVKINRILFRNIAVMGAAWGEWVRTDMAEVGRIQEALNAMIADGLRPPVNVRYALEEVPQAIADLADGKVKGKAIISIAD